MLKYFILLIMMMIVNLNMKKMSMLIIMLVFMFLLKLNPLNNTDLGFMMSMEMMSSQLVILSSFITYLMLLSSNMIWEKSDNIKNYCCMVLLMNLLLILIFSSMNMFMFFLWFEMILIPMFLLILGWGNQLERFNSSFYLMFYTLCGSLPLILGLIYINDLMSLNFMMMTKYMFPKMWNLIFLMAFLIKLPIYLMHYWLPKAHVEAPVSGSMILAGMLLKLGGFGLYRIWNMLEKSFYNNYLISIGLIGGAYSSLLCLRQIDVKSLVAFSSIGHMGVMLGGFLSGNNIGYDGGIIMMIGHGLCSSGMFCIMNMLYERSFTRSLMMMRGIITMSPSAMMFLFLILSSNMSAPPSLNLLSEVMLMGGLIYYCQINILILFLLFMLSCAYSLYLYSMLCHNKFWQESKQMSLNLREMMLVLLHWIPLNTLFLKTQTFVFY